MKKILLLTTCLLNGLMAASSFRPGSAYVNEEGVGRNVAATTSSWVCNEGAQSLETIVPTDLLVALASRDHEDLFYSLIKLSTSIKKKYGTEIATLVEGIRSFAKKSGDTCAYTTIKLSEPVQRRLSSRLYLGAASLGRIVSEKLLDRLDGNSRSYDARFIYGQIDDDKDERDSLFSSLTALKESIKKEYGTEITTLVKRIIKLSIELQVKENQDFLDKSADSKSKE